MATITLNGDLKLDQTAGLQDDDVNVSVAPVDPGPDTLGGDLDADFLAFLNSLGETQLSDDQKAFAALVEGASNPNMVSVTLSTGETVSKLFFSDASGGLFDGDQVFLPGNIPMTTINGDNIFLWSSLDGSKVLATTGSATDSVVAAFFLESNNALNTSAKVESVTFIPIAHPDPNNPDDTVDFGTIMKISAVVSTTPDLEVDDDGPTAPTVVVSTTVTHDETAGVQGAPTATDPNPQNDVALADLPPAVAALFGNIGGTAIGFAAGTAPLVTLSGGEFGTDGPADTDSTIFDAFVNDGTFSGLSTTAGTQIFLYNGTGSLDGLILGRVGIEGGTTDTPDPNGAVAYALFVDPATAVGYIAQHLALNHGAGGSDAAAYDNEIMINSDAVQITVTFTDHDGDQDTSDPVAIGNQLRFQDDGPTITVDPVALELTNTAPVEGTSFFGYDVGSDTRSAAEYTAGESDFVDTDAIRAGTQIDLTGTVTPTTGSPVNIFDAHVDRTSETGTSAEFDVTFSYDGNPLVAGVQTATNTGTLTFDKVNDTYTLSLDEVIQSFSTTILHTSEFLAKNPTGNTGHPEIVVERLAVDDPNTSADEDFYLQFTADNAPLGFSPTGDAGLPVPADKAFTGAAHDLASGTETWVSATQSTNGVAGDTIQKGELLTLRFFNSDILSDVDTGTEKIDPTAVADGITVTFDGIGAAEDLVMILDLIDDKGTADKADDVEITRGLLVDNGDIFRNSDTIPDPYAAEFSLDNNDGLVIIESNDYNLAGEHFQIQGVQIMQSANGLTGTGINLNRATGDTGGSTGTQSFTEASFGNEQDVLKITDIGFVQTQTGTQDASLDFSFQIADGDTDVTGTQTLHVDILNV